MEMPEDEKKDWLDLGAGLGLLVPQYQERMMAAMIKLEREGEPHDLEHITALALVRLVTLKEDEPWIHDRWNKLSLSYHKNYCPVCKELKRRSDDFRRTD